LLEYVSPGLWEYVFIVKVYFWLLSEHYCKCKAIFAVSDVRRKILRGVSFSGVCWSFACGVRLLWRHNLTSYSCFQTNVLAKFV